MVASICEFDHGLLPARTVDVAAVVAARRENDLDWCTFQERRTTVASVVDRVGESLGTPRAGDAISQP